MEVKNKYRLLIFGPAPLFTCCALVLLAGWLGWLTWTRPVVHNHCEDITALYADVDRLNAENKRLKSEVLENKRFVEILRNRVALTGTLHNNNWVAYRDGTKDIVYINHDWTIDGTINNLDLSEKDREWLSGFTKVRAIKLKKKQAPMRDN
jgi:hypothetical protein